MSDEEIDSLLAAVRLAPVWFVRDGLAQLCTVVVLEWHEKQGDGIYAEVGEPAVFFTNGTCAALWNCASSEFVWHVPALLPAEDILRAILHVEAAHADAGT